METKKTHKETEKKNRPHRTGVLLPYGGACPPDFCLEHETEDEVDCPVCENLIND